MGEKIGHPLVIRPSNLQAKRADDQWRQGFLGDMVHRGRSGDTANSRRLRTLGNLGSPLSSTSFANAVKLLSFFEFLPPSDVYRPATIGILNDAIAFERTMGCRLNLSHILALRRLLIIGYLLDTPISVPLTVDDQMISSKGMTVLRFVCPLD